MFSVSEGQVWYEGKAIGPDTALLCAPKELATLNEKEGVLHVNTPRQIDMVFAIGDKVGVVESKKPPDLVASHCNGRLSRQISTIIEVGDVPILLRRGGCDIDVLQELVAEQASHAKRWRPREFWADMNVRYQAMGVWVVDVPDDDKLVRDWLIRCKEAWLGEPSRAVVRRESQPRERRPGWWLRRIPGIGMSISQDMHQQYGSTFETQVAARGENWNHSEKLRRKLEEAGS